MMKYNASLDKPLQCLIGFYASAMLTVLLLSRCRDLELNRDVHHLLEERFGIPLLCLYHRDPLGVG